MLLDLLTVFVKDTSIVLFRKSGSQLVTGNYVGVLSSGNGSSIEIYSRFEDENHRFAFINHMLNKIYDLNDLLLTKGGNNKTDINLDFLLKRLSYPNLEKPIVKVNINLMKKFIRMIQLLEALSI